MPGCCDWDPPSGFGFDPNRSSDVVVVVDDEEDREQWPGLEVEKAAAPLAARRMVARVTSFVMVSGNLALFCKYRKRSSNSLL